MSESLFGMATSSMRQVARSMMVSALNLVGRSSSAILASSFSWLEVGDPVLAFRR